MKSKTGILLLNLGTPNTFETQSIKHYLKEFLNDPRVITLPFWIRWSLVNLFLIPLRARRSTKAYKSIWQKEGSPLLVNSIHLQKALANRLGKEYRVVIGMRYGNPSISFALSELKTCDHLVIIPLFPHYTSAVTGSALEKVLSYIATWQQIPNITVKKDFYYLTCFINSYAELIKKTIEGRTIDIILFSYHGLPERQLNKTSCLENCNHLKSCPIQNIKQHDCYRAKCYITSKTLADACGIPAAKTITAFQSRLGFTPWIQPHLDQLLKELIHKGVKNIAIVCPSFVSDCLETLEEVGIQMRNAWLKLGGGEFVLVPCLNDEVNWVNRLANIITSD